MFDTVFYLSRFFIMDLMEDHHQVYGKVPGIYEAFRVNVPDRRDYFVTRNSSAIGTCTSMVLGLVELFIYFVVNIVYLVYYFVFIIVIYQAIAN